MNKRRKRKESESFRWRRYSQNLATQKNAYNFLTANLDVETGGNDSRNGRSLCRQLFVRK